MPPAKWFFWNRTEARLRAGWRLVIQFVFWIYAPAVLVLILGGNLANGLVSWLPDVYALASLLSEFALRLPAILVSIGLVVRFVDRRPFTDLGFHLTRQWWLDLSFGLVLGAFLMALIFCVEWLAGWITVTGLLWTAQIALPFPVALLGPLIIFVVIGLTEEVHARGYQLRNLAEGFCFPALGARGALIVGWLMSSALFGLLHVRNPNSTGFSTLALMGVGLFFGLGFILTGNLAISIGLHITWNFFQGSIFGFPVSGRYFGDVTLIAIQQSGPVLWTGGAFGPEAGLIGLFAILLGCAMIVGWVRWQYGAITLAGSLAVYKPHMPLMHPRQSSIVGNPSGEKS
ncbi:MAG: CPBP family intramembrane metalloprotease [Chloroflexota bacterium]|nr:CPBP family intramembrane metalloprotease [Chloroflexota bacterium]